MSERTRLRRSVHFVPGANERMLAGSLESAADSLVLDLEDAVVPERKGDARRVVADWLPGVDFGRHETIVRLNPLDSP
jgi:citrate lyase subunit beta / citryl-CoA lyase